MIIRTIVRTGLKGLGYMWFASGLMMFWLFGMSQNQFLDMTVEVVMVPMHVARVIAVHGLGYTIPDELIYGTPERQAERAAEAKADAARLAAGCSGWNPNCRTAEEKAREAEKRREYEAYYRKQYPNSTH